MNPVSARLLSQQLASPQYSDPADVVAHFGAMQAQEYRLMRWAVAMRTRRPSMAAFKDAFDSGRIVRLHLLRGTWQLIPGEDHRWMLDIFAAKADRVIRGWMTANGISLGADEMCCIGGIIERTTGDLGSATKEDYAEALLRHGITMDDHRLSYHIRMCELSGMLCSGDLLPMKATYSLTSQKLAPANTGCSSRPGPASSAAVPVRSASAGPAERDEALGLLARRYFQSHGPATLEDYVWWSGLDIRDCRLGLSLLGDELVAQSLDGRTFYALESARTRGCRTGHAILLPPYDEYLIGYKSRDLVLPAEYRARAHSQNGIFYPVILHDGLVCGRWSPFAPVSASRSISSAARSCSAPAADSADPSTALNCQLFDPAAMPLDEPAASALYLRFRG